MNWFRSLVYSAVVALLVPTFVSFVPDASARTYLLSTQKLSLRDINFIPFPGGTANVSSPDIVTASKYMATAVSDYVPTAGGTMTINGQSLGSYDYRIVTGNQTISSFVNTDWFTTTSDSRSAWVIIKGNLTINSGQTFTPSDRKLFTTVFVTGSCTINGTISMSSRGANHSAATGSNISANAIRIATGTYSSVVNPQVPAAGTSGGIAVSTSQADGVQGVDSSNDGSTAGGASGSGRANSALPGSGSGGTAFTGGTAGGGVTNAGAIGGTSGAIDGGLGGAGRSNAGGQGAGGGAGNPGGATAVSGSPGGNGTGGVLFLICLGALSGSGNITASGANGASSGGTAWSNGGGSGGGSITLLVGSGSSPVPTSLGGTGGTGNGTTGGRGGNGTARILLF